MPRRSVAAPVLTGLGQRGGPRTTVAGVSLGLVVAVDGAVGLDLLHHPLRSLRRLARSVPEERTVLGVAGVARMLVRAVPGLPVVYLTGAAAPTLPAVRRVLRADGYPPGELVGRPGAGLLQGAVRHKRAVLDELMDQHRERRWVLVGDDDGPDPALFAYVAARGRAAAVAVRHLGGADLDLLARLEERAGEVPVIRGRTGEELLPPLATVLGVERQGVADWFLTGAERGNPGTQLRAWTEGNAVRPRVHGRDYLTALGEAVRGAGQGDMVLLGGWRGDAEQLLDGMSAGDALAAAAERGATVRGLLWRSHSRLLGYSWRQNAGFAGRLARGGGRILLDHRVVSFGSHHQKFAVVRYRDQPAADVAFVGGIDIAASRRDDDQHHGDPFTRPFAAVYGDTPPWHDVQVELRGPTVRDVEETFRERWADPSPLVRAPWRVVHDTLQGQPRRADPLPATLPDPPAAGRAAVQLLRTYPWLRQQLPFAPTGERSVARGYAKALSRARRLVYVEDQYLWSIDVAAVFAGALQRAPDLQLIAVVPPFPDQESPVEVPAKMLGQSAAMDMVLRVGGDRVQVLTLENEQGTPVYTHAKLCVIDDVWAAVGSANLNRRSWTHDSELAAAVLDEERDQREPVDPGGLGDGARRFARGLRLTLLREHLGREPGEDDDLLDPDDTARTVRAAAAALDAWHERGRHGPRPPGRLRLHDPLPGPPRWVQPLVGTFYRAGFDPDGRPLGMRLRRTF